MFIRYLESDPVFYISAVVGLIVSITLHELAHGWAAIRRGDDTPIYLGHMTPNPITHMGPIGFIAVFLMGIGWGAMPINPSRLRGRHAEAFVAFAGPLMNLFLALIALTAWALWIKNASFVDPTPFQTNFPIALLSFSQINIVLFLFNLVPIPPLDGSRILVDFNYSYANWLRENEHALPFIFFGFVSIMLSISNTPYGLFSIAGRISSWYLKLWL